MRSGALQRRHRPVASAESATRYRQQWSGSERLGRARLAASRRARLVFAAPIVVAHMRPHAFDHERFLVDGMQPRRGLAALSPLDSTLIRLAARLPIVVVTSHAFVHVQFSLSVRGRVTLAVVAFDTQRHGIGEVADARATDMAISERRRAGIRDARSPPGGSVEPRGAVAGCRCAKWCRASRCAHPIGRGARWRVELRGAACAHHLETLRVVALGFRVGKRIRPPTASLFAVWKKTTFPAAVNLHSRALVTPRAM